MSSDVVTIPLNSTDGSCGPLRDRFAAAPESHRFVVGPENSLLRILIDTVATQPPPFQPITLYGPTGSGKSHLLFGLVERHKALISERPSTVVMLTGADFARGFARAIEVDAVSEWRTKQRTMELFVLDDLQELSTKTAAQQELVQTLDALVEQERQVLFACRHAPMDWKWMLPSLRSRIEGGLTIPVALPSAETQQFIVRELLSNQTEDRAPPFTLPRVNTPLTYAQIRQAVCQHFQTEVDMASASNELTARGQPPAMPMIAKLVARHFQVKLADLVGPSRRQTIVQARGVAIFLVRTLLQRSFEEIGQYFGKRDHTTILHAWRKTADLLNTQVTLKNEVDKLVYRLTNNFEVRSDPVENVSGARRRKSIVRGPSSTPPTSSQ